MHARFRQLLPGLTAALLFILVFLPAIVSAQESDAIWPYAAFYEYDRDLPFNLEERVEKDTDSYTIYYWAYDSIHDKRVTAFYLKPKGLVGPAPVLPVHARLQRQQERRVRRRPSHRGRRVLRPVHRRRIPRRAQDRGQGHVLQAGVLVPRRHGADSDRFPPRHRPAGDPSG